MADYPAMKMNPASKRHGVLTIEDSYNMKNEDQWCDLSPEKREELAFERLLKTEEECSRVERILIQTAWHELESVCTQKYQLARIDLLNAHRSRRLARMEWDRYATESKDNLLARFEAEL
jgi:hypothetical protein